MNLRAGEIGGGAAALALLAVLFLDWFEAQGDLYSGWSGLSKITLVLVCLAAVLSLAVVIVTATRRAVDVQILFDVGATTASFVAVAAVACSLVNQPGLGHDLPGAAVELRWPAYAGLALVIVMAAGMWRAMADERTDARESARTPPPPTPLPRA
jgi:hypothetical protein